MLLNNVKAETTDFSRALKSDIKRSTFNRGSVHTTSIKCGDLVPIYCDEVLPNDTFESKIRQVSRLATPIFPTMDRLKLEYFAFYVPSRILYEDFKALMGENDKTKWSNIPEQEKSIPSYHNTETVKAHSVANYIGVPQGVKIGAGSGAPENALYVNFMPFEAYVQIWNYYFRDENLQAPVIRAKKNDSSFYYMHDGKPLDFCSKCLNVCKPHDYFTSCLPEPQKGSSVVLPIEINELIPVITGVVHSNNGPGIDFDKASPDSNLSGTLKSSSGMLFADGSNPTVPDLDQGLKPINLWADPRELGQISTSTISQLRDALALQRIYETDARGGTRFAEQILAHYGIEVPDYRVQVPEYLGKVSFDIDTYQVPQTSASTTEGDLGYTGAFAHSQGEGEFLTKTFVENGYFMIVACARQKKTYFQGIERYLTRKTRFDFYYPELANISEQPVYNKEIYCLDPASREEVFGYQEAWADYRYKPNRISGLIESDLSFVTYADKYDKTPVLSSGWITDNSEINVDRTLRTSDSPYQLIVSTAIDLVCTRPMPIKSIPGIISHF